MKILFHTNIDSYKGMDWPTLDVVPRKGEYIQCLNEEYCQNNRIPKRLEVCAITYKKDYVSVELWFNETDFKLYGGGEKLLR